MVESEAFLTKPKHQCHLSQQVGWAYGAQTWKKGDYYMSSCLS